MKIHTLIFAFSPLAFFFALSGNVSAQQAVIAAHQGHQMHLQQQAQHAGHAGHFNHMNHWGHANHMNHWGHVNHAPFVGWYPHAFYQQPSIFVGPQVVRYSNGNVFASANLGFGSSVFATPGVTTLRTGSRGPFRTGTSIISNAAGINMGAGGIAQPVTAEPRPQRPDWMNAGVPVGGPVGTWYEDSATPGNVKQYIVHADGTYEMSEFSKNVSGMMKNVTGTPARKPFEMNDDKMVLDPKGSQPEGPYAVSLSVNALGQMRATLKDGQSGQVRVWRSAP